LEDLPKATKVKSNNLDVDSLNARREVETDEAKSAFTLEKILEQRKY